MLETTRPISACNQLDNFLSARIDSLWKPLKKNVGSCRLWSQSIQSLEVTTCEKHFHADSDPNALRVRTCRLVLGLAHAHCDVGTWHGSVSTNETTTELVEKNAPTWFFNTRNVGFFSEGVVGAEEEKVFAVRWARASHVESSRLTPTTQTSDVGSNAPRKKLIDERWCGDIFHNKRVCFLLVFCVCVVMSMCFRIRQRARNKSVRTILRITLAHPPSSLHKLNYWNDLKVHKQKGLSQPDPYFQSGDICEITFPSTIYKFERRSRDEIYCRAKRPETKMRMEKKTVVT